MPPSLEPCLNNMYSHTYTIHWHLHCTYNYTLHGRVLAHTLIRTFILQVSSNGIMTFHRSFPVSSTPTPFPYGNSRLPTIAPLWMDLDFRDPSSRVYHRMYDDSGSPSLGEAVLNKFNRRLPGSTFRAEWIAVFTWSGVLPYPHYAYQDCYTGVSSNRCMHAWAIWSWTAYIAMYV